MTSPDQTKQVSSLTYYHAPHSRSSVGLWLLEELEVAYQLQIVDFRDGRGADESYRAVHPHKKVPALVHDGAVIIESAAIAIYLSDRFPRADLTPAVGDARRGPYLSWLVYASTVFDPAVTAKLLKWEYQPSAVSFGAFADMERHLEKTLTAGPYLLGDRPSLADLQWAANLNWAMFAGGLFTDKPVFGDYVARMQTRPSWARFLAAEAAAQRDVTRAAKVAAQAPQPAHSPT
jgi:glutathione S-transferase